MLKISKIAKHTTKITCGCPQLYEQNCGIMYRSY